MQNINKIQSKGEYSLKACNRKTKMKDGHEEFCQIKDFVLSPNNHLIALVITKEIFQAASYGCLKHQVEVIEMKTKKKIIVGEWLNSKFSEQVFPQFSSDSNYLIYQILKKLIIIDIQTKQQVTLDGVDKFHTIDNKNQVFLNRENQIQIYEIEKKTFQKITDNSSNYFDLLKIQSQLFLKFQSQQYLILFSLNQQKNIQKFNYLNQPYNYEFKLFQNQFVISHFELKRQLYIQLRSLRNFKLLRSVISKEEYETNLIQDINNVYVCKAIFNKQHQLDNYSRFNLITGQIKLLRIQINKPQQRVYFTNSILVDLDEECEKLRYFIFKE